jgi:hypothetical protein
LQLDFLLPPPPCSAAASPLVAPSPDVDQPRPSSLLLQQLPVDDPTIIVRGPVLRLAPLPAPSLSRLGGSGPGSDVIVSSLQLPLLRPDLVGLGPTMTSLSLRSSCPYQTMRVCSRGGPSSPTPLSIPTNYRNALADAKWRAAMIDEYQALIDKTTMVHGVSFLDVPAPMLCRASGSTHVSTIPTVLLHVTRLAGWSVATTSRWHRL